MFSGMSSSTTRLTKEFRYLLDMINIVSRVGWFRAAASRAGSRGRGQGSAGRPTAQRLWTTAALPQPRLLVPAIGFAALDMLSDQHLTVEDPHQMLRGDRLHRLPGQHDRHPVVGPSLG